MGTCGGHKMSLLTIYCINLRSPETVLREVEIVLRSGLSLNFLAPCCPVEALRRPFPYLLYVWFSVKYESYHSSLDLDIERNRKHCAHFSHRLSVV